MTESPSQHRPLAPGPSPHLETIGDSPSEERRGSVDSAKKRCSGEAPCDTCRVFHRECVFDETLDQRRRVAAKRTADELSYNRDMLNDLLTVMRAEDHTYALTLLDIIRGGATSEDIRVYINNTLHYIEGTGRESQEAARVLERVRQVVNVEGAGQSFRPQVMDIHFLCDDVPHQLPATPWTTVTMDSDLVSHLVSLYFTWDYPFHAFLDRDVFLKYMARGKVKSQFCCPFLVNALLANACHFSDYTEAYVVPGDIMTKGCDFLAEAERLRDEEPEKLTLSYLQGTLLLYERYSLAGKDDLGYKTLHQAIEIGKSMGLVGRNQLSIKSDPAYMEEFDEEFLEDMDVSTKRTAWGLFHIDTPSDKVALWTPYPTHRDPRPSSLDEYFDKSCNLCEIARDMSQRLFATTKIDTPVEERNKSRDALYERLRCWDAELPRSFDTSRRPPPYILILRMRYYALVINLFLYRAEDEVFGIEWEGILTPESLSNFSPFSRHNKGAIAQSAAREIAGLTHLHRREYGMSRAHHFAIYAINLALFVMVEHSLFDILDPDFLLLASAFSSLASRSHIGRNLFHLFRQNVRAKAQGSRIRGSGGVSEELKALFDEKCTSPTVFDDYAQGLEKLDEERYHIKEKDPLSDMLAKYENLSLGRDDSTPERLSVYSCMIVMDDPFNSSDRPDYSNNQVNQNVGSLSPNPAAPSQSQSASSDWMWRTGSFGPGNMPQLNYTIYPYAQYPDLNASQQASMLPPQDAMTAPKIAIPRATAVKTSQRRRSARACEPCRQRKVKCDGARPECRKCLEHGLGCSYIDIKRIRDQKQLGVLAKKVERYRKILRQLESEAEPAAAKRIKKMISTLEQPQSDADADADDDVSDVQSSTSHGSLDEMDLVKEDLNRSQKTVAIGFFGKNSEVAWMQKLEDVSDQRSHYSDSDGEKPVRKEIPIMSMSYHLDDLAIPFPDSVDPFEVPPKELADQYFNAYMESVHPSFTVIRMDTFTSQYEQFFNKTPSFVPRKWLAVLNMIFALGCRYCKLTGKVGAGQSDTDDLEFLNRTRKLCLSGNVLFEHDDLQQIQVVLLVAFYLVALGQVNSASKFSSMALHSAISLGINLRFKDDKTHFASKEARNRLWWSIFLLEHLLTSITGRISGCGEGLSAALLPVPFEEGEYQNQEFGEIFRDPSLQASRLQPTLYQTDEEVQSVAAWLAECKPGPTLLFHCIVDLQIIAQTVINNVYSIQGLRESPGALKSRLQKHSCTMDAWLCKVPKAYRFTSSDKDDNFRIPKDGKHTRECITLAIYYFSARITLCRPCLSHAPSTLQKARDPSSRSNFHATMTLTCLRASCSLLSILPDKPDTIWLTTVTPWWAILHFIMQATTALLIGLSTCAGPESDMDVDNNNSKISSLNRASMIKESRKAFHWLHHLAFSSKAARRAFTLCESFLNRMGTTLGLDISDLPSSESLPPQKDDIDMRGDGLTMVDDGY
ncbi:fungal-specific transcription factor domain-containing protein [Aspergillus cavernicola]|uniref:Fungal-specific transcription factor domain-containing protein n=1 Tax=Aspergillus cavernicola TaxID=176166 RepID=A0ABR4IAR8_9EURO